MKTKFHLFDLPHNDLYIELDKDFVKWIFNEAIKKFGDTNKLAKILHSKSRNIIRWRNRTRSPLIKILYQLVAFGISSEKEIEKNIIAIKKCAGFIKNPKLPIVLSKDLARIIAATFCDGGINSDYAVHYTNKDSNLRISFQKSIKDVFGDVKLIHQDERHPGVFQITYSGVMGIILNKIFGVPKRSKIFIDTPIPELIMDANNEIITAFIRQCFDDEGWVSKGVKLCRAIEKNALKSEKGPLFLQQLSFLLKDRFGIIAKIRLKKEREYYSKNKKIEVKDFILDVCDRNSSELFYSKIGFDIHYKMQKLKNFLNSYKLWQIPKGKSLNFFLRECAKFILEKDEPFSAKDIYLRIKKSRGRVVWAIRELYKRSLIKLVDYKFSVYGSRVPLYTLTNKGFGAVSDFVDIHNLRN